MPDFREEIKKIIRRKGMSIAKLARRADLNQGTVYNYVNGVSDMMGENIQKLLDVLNRK